MIGNADRDLGRGQIAILVCDGVAEHIGGHQWLITKAHIAVRAVWRNRQRAMLALDAPGAIGVGGHQIVRGVVRRHRIDQRIPVGTQRIVAQGVAAGGVGGVVYDRSIVGRSGCVVNDLDVEYSTGSVRRFVAVIHRDGE